MRKITTKILLAAALAALPGLVLATCGKIEDDRDTYTVNFNAGYIVKEKKVARWEYEGDTYEYEYEESVYVELVSTSIQTNTLGKLPYLPTVPERPDDYSFDGWYTTGGTRITIQTQFIFDTTVAARWRSGDTVEIGDGPVAREFTRIRNALAGGQPDSEYTVNVNADETIFPQTLYHDGNKKVTIILNGNTTATGVLPMLTLSGGGNIFAVEKNVTLKLNNIRMQGGDRNSKSLLAVNSGGTLIIGENANDKTYIGNNGSEDDRWGGGITVNKGGEVIMNGGEINGCRAYEDYPYNDPEGFPGGGGVFVRGGTFTMNAGSIQDCSASMNAGGVLIDLKGRFFMKGGRIYNNVAPYGGGVMVFRGGLFEMTGGAIHKNISMYGGGVFVEHGSNDSASANPYDPRLPDGPNNDPARKEGFYFSGGDIYDNGGNRLGGGVLNYVSGLTYMTGNAKIRDNSGREGGGVYNEGLFIMMGGTIESNSGVYGGGVDAAGGIFIMEDGKITGNTAEQFGAGVLAYEQFVMHGGEISDNVADGQCGGVYLTSSGNFAMSGGVIKGNRTTNTNQANTGTLYFAADNYLSPTMRGIAYYGTRPDGTVNPDHPNEIPYIARPGDPIVIPIGHEGPDRDGSPSFIIDSNLADYSPPNTDGVQLPLPWGNNTTIELEVVDGNLIRKITLPPGS